MQLAKDKQLHILAGIILAWTGLIVTGMPIVAGVIAGLFWGFTKEAIDKWGLFYQRRTGWDNYDVLATFVGGLLGGIYMKVTGVHEAVSNSKNVGEIFSEAPFAASAYILAITAFIYIYRKARTATS